MPDELIFSDDLLDGAQEDFENWEPPAEFAPAVPAGVYSMYLTEIREPKEFDTKEQGKRLSASLDFRIAGGPNDERAITWQKVTNIRFERGRGSGKFSSRMLDVLKSAGVQQAPTSNKEYFAALQALQSRGKAACLKGQVDWRGFCTTCYERALLRQTGSPDIQAAKVAADNDQYQIANKEATKAKSFRGFPLNDKGVREDVMLCKECGDEIRAQVNITRYIT